MKKTLLSAAFIGAIMNLQAQTYSFTNAGATGQNGPDQVAVDAAYTATNLAGAVTINTQGIQEWTVPTTGLYHITAIGACGGELQGTYFPGLPGTGATIEGDFALTAGTVLNIVVGQKGVYGDNGSGGGGGSFVFTGTPGGGGLMIAAGGGGGHGHGSASVPTGANGGGGSDTQNQVDGAYGTGNGGSQGVGLGGFGGTGACSYSGVGAGGAGWTSNGVTPTCGTATGGDFTTFVGGYGGADGLVGGFGGGGGSDGDGSPGGGGGGYTGGGGGNDFNGSVWGAGAGAGSYNIGTNQTNTAGVTGAASGYSHGSVTIDVVCVSPNNGVTLTTTTLTSDETNGAATYQWIDCDNAGAAIAGETNVSYTPTVTGNYAVVVGLNGCSDTSTCTLVDFTGINELNAIKFNIYPNPGSGEFNLDFAVNGEYEVVVYDLAGKAVFSGVFNSSSNKLNLTALGKGVYQVNVQNAGIVSTKKLVIM